MENNVIHLFVYGSLRSGFHHSAYKYISKYFTLIGEAKVKGILFDMGDYAAAVPATGETFITGELYKAKSPDDFLCAIEQLDVYEGVNPEEGEVPLFRRELTEVIFNNAKIIVWIYWYNRDLDHKRAVSPGDFMDVIRLRSKSR